MRVDREPNAPEVTLTDKGIESAHMELAERRKGLPLYERQYPPLARLWAKRITYLEKWLKDRGVEG